jgi:hypothetical protein
MIFPPAMSRVTPVIHADASEAKNSAAAETSWGRRDRRDRGSAPRRRVGFRWREGFQ